MKKYQTSLQRDLQPVRALHQQISAAVNAISTSEAKLKNTMEAKLQVAESTFDSLVKILADERQHVTKSIRESFEGQQKMNATKRDEISAVLDKLQSVIQSTEISEPNPRFLESVATKRRDITAVVKIARNISQRPTELSQREAELLSPARFKEICSSSNFTYIKEDPFKGHFDKSFDPLNLQLKKMSTSILHIENVKESLFKKVTVKAHLCSRDGTSEAVAVEKITPEQYSLSFVPQKRGRQELHIMYNDTHICGSPLPVYVTIPPQQLKKPISTMEIENSSGIKCYRGKIYVSSRSDGGIIVLDSVTWRTKGSIELPGIREALVTPEYIYATARDDVLKMDRDGTVLKTNSGNFNFSNGIRQSKKKEMYVCDLKNHRVQVLDEDLSLIRIIGGKGEMDGCFK